MDRRRQRKRWSGEEIVRVLRRRLTEGVEVSKVCEEAECHPSQMFRWEKQFFGEGAKVYDRKPAESGGERKLKQRMGELERKLRRKDQAPAELMEDHVAPRKGAGGAWWADGPPPIFGTRSSIS